MFNKPIEFNVYWRLTEFLHNAGWQIICASPPGGTDTRYRKCVLPRRDSEGSDKGSRDEVDLTAAKNDLVLLAECKPRLSDSLRLVNALGETDYDKLKRIVLTTPSEKLGVLLHQAYGITLPSNITEITLLAVETIDCELPPDMSVIELGSKSVRLWLVDPLSRRFG